jgi:putative transposase
MKLRYPYRCYPTDQQKVELSKLFGCGRVVWNDALAYCQQQYQECGKKPSYKELSKRLTQSKKTEERIWLGEVSSVPLQQSLIRLEQAYSSFFSSCNGKRKGKKVKPPKFKKLKKRQSAEFTRKNFQLKNTKIYLPKIGNITVIWSRELPSIPSSVTVIKDCADRYFVSFVVDFTPEQLPYNDNSVGIDLGIIDFATLSNGEKVKAPKPFLKRLKRLRKVQRNLSKRQKGSKRREKARKRVARLHAKISDTRNDFLHKLSTKIINENQVIVLEDLNVSGMIKNRRLSRAISDLGWRSFRTMLEAKSVMYGRDFRVIDRWTPTSQTCSCCGFKGGKKELNVREWTCLNCGITHDRDINASINIKVAGGLSETLNGCGGRRKTAVKVAASCEASTPQNLSSCQFLIC